MDNNNLNNDNMNNNVNDNNVNNNVNNNVDNNANNNINDNAGNNMNNPNPTEKANSSSFEEKAKAIINDVADDSASFTAEEIEKGKGLSVISYIGALSLISYFVEKNNNYVKYHAKQGLNLFIIEIIGDIALYIISLVCGWYLRFIPSILSTVFGICVFALSVIGIINVLNGKAKELPVVNKIKIIK